MVQHLKSNIQPKKRTIRLRFCSTGIIEFYHRESSGWHG